LAALGYDGHTVDDLGKVKPADEYEMELQVMAEVRGYFQMYKCIIDNVPSMIVYCMSVKGIADDMLSSLITKFGLGTTDANRRCSIYLAENPEVVLKRKERAARKEGLEEIKHALHAFGLS